MVAQVPAAGWRQGTLAGRVWHVGSALQAVNPRAQPRRRAGLKRSTDRSRRRRNATCQRWQLSLSLSLSLSRLLTVSLSGCPCSLGNIFTSHELFRVSDIQRKRLERIDRRAARLVLFWMKMWILSPSGSWAKRLTGLSPILQYSLRIDSLF